MDFSFSAEQKLLQSTLRDFAERELSPAYASRDKDEDLPRSMVRLLGAIGLLSPIVEPRFGGQGLDYVSLGLAHEEIARADFNAAYVMLLSALVGAMSRRAVTSANARRSCRRFAAARRSPRSRSRSRAPVRRGAREAAGPPRRRRLHPGWRESSISFASSADTALVMARTGPIEHGARGISAFYVDLHSPGVTRTRFKDLGSRAIGRGQLFFDSVRVPAGARIGDEGAGFVQVMQGFDFSRALIGLMCIGAAEQSLDETRKYVIEREAFGGSIARFEGVSFPIAEAAVQLRAARLLCYEALWLRDRGEPHGWLAAGCKWWAPELAAKVLHQCLLLHGHLGFSLDLPHQQRLRDVIGLEIGDGTAQIMKLVVARELLGNIARGY